MLEFYQAYVDVYYMMDYTENLLKHIANVINEAQFIINGAERVIGFEFDFGALETAYYRAKTEKLCFLPLHLDAANPSPSQGWNQQERIGLTQRRNADAVIALAVIHHLCIGRNIPLESVVDWIVATAPKELIEFIPKGDAMVQEMLSLREDIFANYTVEIFTDLFIKK